MSGSEGETKVILLFYSYAQDDQKHLAELDKSLSVLRRAGLITTWSAQVTSLGRMPIDEIRAHIDSAQIFLMLVTPAYIDDPECYEQMEYAINRAKGGQLTILPILARPTPDLELLPIDDWKILPRDGKAISVRKHRDLAYNNIAGEIRQLVESLQPVRRAASLPPRAIEVVAPLLNSRIIYPRTDLVQDVYRKLIDADTSGLVLTGLGGIGKSTLAALVCKYAEEERLAGRGPFTAEALRLRLNPTATLLDLLDILRTVLGKPGLKFAHLSAQQQAVELFNLLYQGSAVRLVVLDQFDVWLHAQTGVVHSEQVGVAEWFDMINDQVVPCRLLLTSRVWPQGAQTYRPLCMQKFPIVDLKPEEGVEFLKRRGLQDSDADLKLAVERCRGLPLALGLLDKLQQSKRMSLASLLNDPEYRKIWIEDVEKNIFGTIYEQQLDDNQRNLLFAFSIYRTPISKQAAQAVVQNQLSQEQLTSALRVLQENGLLQYQGASTGSYELHPLIIELVRQRFLKGDESTSTNILHKAHSQAADHYLQQFRFTSSRQREGVEDVQYLVEAIWHYCQAGQQQTAYGLLKEQRIFTDLQRWGRNAALLEIYLFLLPSSAWKPAPEQEGDIYNEIGDIYGALGQKDKARQYYEQALALFKQEKFKHGEVKALINLGAICRVYDQIEQALSYYQHAMQLSDEIKDEFPERGILLHNIGRAYQSLARREQPQDVRRQNFELALHYYEQAINAYDAKKGGSDEAYTRNNMGEIHVALSQYEQARQDYEQVLDVFLELGERRGEGIVYNNLGVMNRRLEQDESAFEYYVQALAIFREIGDRWEEAGVLKNLGRLFFIVQRFDAALACFWLAADIGQAIHKSVDSAAVPAGMRRFLREERFEPLWSQAEDHAALIVEQAIRAGIAIGETGVADANGDQQD